MSPARSNTLSRKRRRVVGRSRRPRAADAPSPPAYFRRKAIFDRITAALLLAPGLPIIGVLVLFVRLTSRGPGIYRQVRIGQDGREFTMYKIRTMRQNAEALSGPVWTSSHDPRVTPLGKVLRRFHLDELPQLLNVLKGEMALIGPRPERPEFVHVLADSVPGYRKRLAVRPGVTGLAQLNFPPDTDLASVYRKLLLDCQYIQEAGLWLDFRLFTCTFFRLFKLPERWLLPMFALRGKVAIPADFEGPSDSGGAGSGSSAATPAAILVQSAAAPTDGNGSDRRRDKHSRKRLPDGNGRPKPR